MTTAVYDTSEFIQSRYGITMWTNGPTGIFNQTFRNCRFETLECLGIMHAVGGESVSRTAFYDSYVENWGRPLLVAVYPDITKPPATDA